MDERWTSTVERIVSGGQAGADRAALDVALALGIACGGWVPAGRWAEDGAISERYPNMRETVSAKPRRRTERNVRDSDATLVFSCGSPEGGTELTVRMAQKHGKALLVIDVLDQVAEVAAARVRAWLDQCQPRVLNVAGPRSSKCPEIYMAVRDTLTLVFAEE
jgi:hypothetical protein